MHTKKDSRFNAPLSMLDTLLWLVSFYTVFAYPSLVMMVTIITSDENDEDTSDHTILSVSGKASKWDCFASLHFWYWQNMLTICNDTSNLLSSHLIYSKHMHNHCMFNHISFSVLYQYSYWILSSLPQTDVPSRSLCSASEQQIIVQSQRGKKSLSHTFILIVPC